MLDAVFGFYCFIVVVCSVVFVLCRSGASFVLGCGCCPLRTVVAAVCCCWLVVTCCLLLAVHYLELCVIARCSFFCSLPVLSLCIAGYCCCGLLHVVRSVRLVVN